MSDNPMCPLCNGSGKLFPVCEYAIGWNANLLGGVTPICCGDRATLRYPAAGGGFMHLCDKHGQPHLAYAERIT